MSEDFWVLLFVFAPFLVEFFIMVFPGKSLN
jgi:hypothetical protein